MKRIVHRGWPGAFVVVLSVAVPLMANRVKADDVPKIVEKGFEQYYPGVEVDKWEQDDKKRWEAKFELNDIKYRADFFEDGSWRETERDIDFLELPYAIRKSIMENFADEELNEIEWVDSPDKGQFFDVEFKKEGPNMDVVYAPDGTIIDIENP